MTPPKKNDYLVAAIAGFITGLLALPSLKNIGAYSGYLRFALPVVMPILWVVGLAFAKILTRWLSFTYQFAKFVIVGFLNTMIDFGALNLLSLITGVTSGFFIGGVNLPGFVLAAANSYLWNKFWVFKKERAQGEKTDYSDFWSFLAVAVVTMILNSGTVIAITTFITPVAGLSPERWLNIAKICATVVSLVFNFLGFKFFVFKPKAAAPSAITR